MTTVVPAAEAAFLAEIVESARTLYASVGRMSPSALIRTAPGALPGSPGDMLVLAMPQIGGTMEDKLDAMGIIRHHSIRLDSPRSAILAESWSIDANEKTEREMQALHRQGKGMGDHPDAYELVMIVIESDAGATHASLSIDRRHDSMTVLELRDETTFVPRGAGSAQPMLLSDFHVPMSARIFPQVIAWAKEMDAVHGDPRERAMERADAKAATTPDIPETTRH